MGGRVGGLALELVLNLLLARLLPRPVIGTYLLLTSAVAAAAVLAQLGLNQAVVPLVAATLAQSRLCAARRAACAVGRWGLGGSVVTALLLMIGLRTIAHERVGAACAILAGLWLVAQAGQNLVGETFRGFGRLRLATLYGGLAANLLLITLLVLAKAAHQPMGLALVLGAGAATGLGVATVGCFALRRLLETLPQAIGSEPTEKPALLPTAGPLWIT